MGLIQNGCELELGNAVQFDTIIQLMKTWLVIRRRIVGPQFGISFRWQFGGCCVRRETLELLKGEQEGGGYY